MAQNDEQEESLYFSQTEEIDVRIFQNFLTPHYQPSERPIAMAVGAILPTEKSVIKVYHQRQFGIPIRNTRVAMTNNEEMPPSMESNPRFQYDHSSFGLQGDAKMSYCYMAALGAFDRFDRRFDLVYIRNPDLCNCPEWALVFVRALEWTTSEGGVAVTLIRQTDVDKFRGLLGILKDQFDIVPIFSGETHICPESEHNLSNDQHTIGVFKPKHNL